MVTDRREPTLGGADLDLASIADAPRRKPTLSDPRNPWLAFFSGLLFPPIGFAYVGRPLVVIILYAVFIAFCAVLGWSGFAQRLSGIVFIYVASIGMTLFMAVYCAVLAWRTRAIYRKKWFNRWYYYIAYFLIATLPIVYVNTHRETCVGFDTYRVPSGAMEPTIRAGELIVADARPNTIAKLKPGDVAILVLDPSNDVHFVKRIVAGPGEHVQITTQGLVVNGRLQSREHTQGGDMLQERFMKYADVTLGDDEFYVMGDNRGNSIDSRAQGPVNRANFRGKAAAIFFSGDYDRLGPIL